MTLGRSNWQNRPRGYAETKTELREMLVPVGNSILLATDIESGDAPALCERCVYRNLKPERSGDEVRPKGRVNL